MISIFNLERGKYYKVFSLDIDGQESKMFDNYIYFRNKDDMLVAFPECELNEENKTLFPSGIPANYLFKEI